MCRGSVADATQDPIIDPGACGVGAAHRERNLGRLDGHAPAQPVPVRHPLVFDCYTQHASPEYPTIYPLDSQLVGGQLIAGGGASGIFQQIENDFWQSYAPTVTNAWNQQYSPINVSNNILSFAIWSDQPGTLQIFDPNSSAPLPINNAQSIAFPAGTSSNFMTTVTDYLVPTPQYFIQINNTGTGVMGTQFFYFYLMSYPTFVAGFRG